MSHKIIEWRVTGRPYVSDREIFEFVWSPLSTPWLGDSETAARQFMAIGSGWADGPHLSMRSVEIGEWEPVDGQT